MHHSFILTIFFFYGVQAWLVEDAAGKTNTFRKYRQNRFGLKGPSPNSTCPEPDLYHCGKGFCIVFRACGSRGADNGTVVEVVRIVR
ncbi:hypothetical protein GQ602_005946 [Ophiocordyceps camponoti-floridani]|uniref:Secreted protein n=1 Tax=Ophiocordyceps camponoti-floridani TaxID=2030778 RepID=A0A8H4Q2C6_9HYPO|nr:hypothetical protein GQ602_005946 [Ophiocordyceps camponoti-floridani]